MKRAKLYALVALAVISLLMPVIETLRTGGVETFSAYGMVETFLSIPPIYWWYYVDKQEQGYQSGPLMNVGIVALAVIVFPIYFIRSRGWRRGGLAIVKAGVFVGAIYLVELAGEAIGKALGGIQ